MEKVLHYTRERKLPDGQINRAECYLFPKRNVILFSESYLEGGIKKKFTVKGIQDPENHDTFWWMEAEAIMKGKKPPAYLGTIFSEVTTFQCNEADIDSEIEIQEERGRERLGPEVPADFDMLKKAYEQQKRVAISE